MPAQPRFRSKRTLARQPAPPGIYASTYDPELGAAICRRVAAGESLRAICADPSMPTGKTVWNWARAHEDFRLMKAHALSVARARSLAARDGRELARQARFGGPHGRTGAPCGYDPEIADEITFRVMMGETLADVCRDPLMPSVGTVYNWLRKYPEFLEHYRRAKAMVEEVLVETACEALQWPGERAAEPLLRRTVRAAEKRARRLSLKRYAPPSGPAKLTVELEDARGRHRVIYGGSLPQSAHPGESRDQSEAEAGLDVSD